MKIPVSERIISLLYILYRGSTEDSTNNQTLPSKQRHVESHSFDFLMSRSSGIRIGKQ